MTFAFIWLIGPVSEEYMRLRSLCRSGGKGSFILKIRRSPSNVGRPLNFRGESAHVAFFAGFDVSFARGGGVLTFGVCTLCRVRTPAPQSLNVKPSSNAELEFARKRGSSGSPAEHPRRSKASRRLMASRNRRIVTILSPVHPNNEASAK